MQHSNTLTHTAYECPNFTKCRKSKPKLVLSKTEEQVKKAIDPVQYAWDKDLEARKKAAEEEKAQLDEMVRKKVDKKFGILEVDGGSGVPSGNSTSF